MCTVTYLPLGKNDFILTSNRDENPNRKTIAPKKYRNGGVKLIYPKDKLAGGTWIGLSEKKRLICLLNGGFEKHIRVLPYKTSRGIIVKKLLKSNNALEEIKKYSFENIEPFTIILVDWNNLLRIFEFVWDGKQKHLKKINQEPKIWSSSTLYDKKMRQLRQKWFTTWLQKQQDFTKRNIIAFHQDETKGGTEVSLKMKRKHIETVSTTCVVKKENNITMEYITYTKTLNLPKTK